MIALLSVKPEFEEKIFSGKKCYEYRKRIFKNNVEKVVVYSSKPKGLITGEFDVKEILRRHPSELWRETGKKSGISENFYHQYFRNRDNGYAISIGKKRLYTKPINPYEILKPFIPPQSFHYLNEREYECLIQFERKLRV